MASNNKISEQMRDVWSRLLPEDVVDADYTMRSRRSAVVYNGGLALHPHPAAIFGQETVVLGRHLSLQQN